MIRYGELDQEITVYTRHKVHETIPIEYHRQVMKLAIAMNNDGKHWDMHQSAIVLLYLAFGDGHLQPSQLTAGGLKALEHAEKLLLDHGVGADEIDDTGKIFLKCVG